MNSLNLNGLINVTKEQKCFKKITIISPVLKILSDFLKVKVKGNSTIEKLD